VGPRGDPAADGLTVLVTDGAAPAPAVLAQAIEVLRGGGLLIYPTDTLYALGGCALDPSAGARVRAAKGRPGDKPLPIVAADLEQARRLCEDFPPSATLLAAAFWPGPLTLVLPVRPEVPVEVTAGGRTVAIRVPALELTRALCRGAGPLIATSANRAGQPAPVTCAEALSSVGLAAVLALDAGPGRPQASTIVDLSAGAPRLLRVGAIAWPDVQGVLQEPPG